MIKLEYHYAKLKGRIVEKYGSQERFSEVLGLSRVSVSKKLNGISGFSQEDIEVWSGLLGISTLEYAAYFFT